MRNGIAEDAQANFRMYIACDLRPVFKISQRVALGSWLFLVHVIPNEVRNL